MSQTGEQNNNEQAAEEEQFLLANDQEQNNIAENTPQVPNPTNAAQQMHISRISVRAPPFWKENPALWFKQLESQFQTNGITVSETKYHIAVAALDTAVINQVSDIVMFPPASGKYEALKQRLQDVFADSQQQRLKKLLKIQNHGDKRPSHLWREMRDLAGSEINDNLLKSLWLQQLPAQIQAIVSTDSSDITRLLIMADKIHEIIEVPSHVYGVDSSTSASVPNRLSAGSSQSSMPSSSQFDQLCTQVNALTLQISQLSGSSIDVIHRNARSPNHTRDRTPFFSRSRSQNSQSRNCYYHRRFGAHAKKCTKPCAFMPAEN